MRYYSPSEIKGIVINWPEGTFNQKRDFLNSLGIESTQKATITVEIEYDHPEVWDKFGWNNVIDYSLFSSPWKDDIKSVIVKDVK